MKTISLKLDDAIFAETERILSKIKISRNRYINDAVDSYNNIKNRELIKEQLEIDSYAVREESMNVLREFEDLGYSEND
jgi:metal-responsive CopG/Arc/MetJ family transcriptional regulator